MIQKKSNFFENIKDNNSPLFFILGPCVMESEEHVLKIATFLKKLSVKLNFNFIFKSSFDKANRTSLSGARGVGLEKGLKIFEKIKKELNLPVITDIHETIQVNQVASIVDVLQIPAFLCRQTDLLVKAGQTGKPINIKKGQFITAENMGKVIEKVESTGNQNIWLCERGYSFGYNNLIVDYRNFPILKSFNKPVIFDVTHSVQRPSVGNSTQGDRKFVPNLAGAAIIQGIAGIFMEVHDNPEKALSDGPNSIRLSDLEDLIKYFMNLDSWAKSNKIPEIK